MREGWMDLCLIYVYIYSSLPNGPQLYRVRFGLREHTNTQWPFTFSARCCEVLRRENSCSWTVASDFVQYPHASRD